MINSRQRILVTLDGSELAELALREALALAKLPDSEVTLLQVVPPIEEVIADGEEVAIAVAIHAPCSVEVIRESATNTQG